MKAPGYVSEGDEVQQVIMQVALTVNKREIYVYDRGGDGDVMFAFFLGKWRGPGERFDGRGDLQMELGFADG